MIVHALATVERYEHDTIIHGAFKDMPKFTYKFTGLLHVNVRPAIRLDESVPLCIEEDQLSLYRLYIH